jgi:oxalate decarboxylase
LRTGEVRSPQGTVPHGYAHRLMAQKPIEAPGGRVRIVDSSNFPAATTIAAALIEVDPAGMRNTGNTPPRFLEMFRSDRYADVSLDQSLALTPFELVRAHVNVGRRFIAALSKRKELIVYD